jgi:SOS-response transcriptional repressor LexA
VPKTQLGIPNQDGGKPTLRQAQALGHIVALISLNGMSPSIEELAAAMGIVKPAARALVQHLERKGYITRTPGKCRSIRVLERKVC